MEIALNAGQVDALRSLGSIRVYPGDGAQVLVTMTGGPQTFAAGMHDYLRHEAMDAGTEALRTRGPEAASAILAAYALVLERLAATGHQHRAH